MLATADTNIQIFADDSQPHPLLSLLFPSTPPFLQKKRRIGRPSLADKVSTPEKHVMEDDDKKSETMLETFTDIEKIRFRNEYRAEIKDGRCPKNVLEELISLYCVDYRTGFDCIKDMPL